MDYTFSNREYILLRDLIHREGGINVKRLRKELLLSRLSKRLRELHLESFKEYYELAREDERERVILIDYITTNKTEFFRETDHFEFLKKIAVPEIMAQGGKKIRIWSAGCSTGEEPYSIAITILDTPWVKSMPDVKILSSDISTRVLKKAMEGVYDRDTVSSIPPDDIHKYFLLGIGDKKGLFKIKPFVQEMILFERINLCDDDYRIHGQFDIIFCRNVFIYFDRKTQVKIVNSLMRYLKAGGYLICGHAETLSGMVNGLHMVQPSIYKNI